MNFLGIGPLELLFAFIILLLLFGPRDLVAMGKKFAEFIRKMRDSEIWTASTYIKSGHP